MVDNLKENAQKRGGYMKQKGFTLIELITVVAILGIIAVVVIPNISKFTATNETAITNETIFEGLASQPISNLNLTQLNFMVNYCMQYAIYVTNTSARQILTINEKYSGLVAIYQNQIIINELREQP
jgi:prepilin-type N-terminal cleavage/methylation domain-containing protein